MSKFFKALEHAERDITEQVPRAPVEAMNQRPSVMTRWPEQTKERPPVFSARWWSPPIERSAASSRTR